MTITIERNGKIDVYEDVQLFVGAITTAESSRAIIASGIEQDKNVPIFYASAARALRKTLEDDPFPQAEALISLVEAATGETLQEEVK